MVKLIVNADDFGYSTEINRAIELAYKDGFLSSATLVANMEGFEEAIEIKKQLPHLGLGVHLNIFRGKSLKKHTYLTNKDGLFHRSVVTLFLRFLFHRKQMIQEIREELCAQIERIQSNGIFIDHFDSEKHMHLFFRPLHSLIVWLMQKYNVKWVRLVNEKKLIQSSFSFMQFVKMLILNFQSRHMKRLLNKSENQYPNYFWGVLASGNIDIENYKYCLKYYKKKDGVLEIMMHPGYFQQGLKSFLKEEREKELQILLSKELHEIIKQEFELTNYANL